MPKLGSAESSSTNNDPLMTVAEAALYSNLSAVFLRRRIAAEALPSVRFGRAIRIRQSDLDGYLSRGDSRP